MEKLIEQYYGCGVWIVITQGLRTYAEQDALYAQGRNGDKRPKVTKVRGGYSNHNFGFASGLEQSRRGSQETWPRMGWRLA
ncbi:M15 family metallopeptidase [Paenibacillus sp. FSL R10-2748]|uniref:M15 family metallopeptidase n=1 Tax=Paenibacillus sp. FSL R10-2748 TaxID=2954658 RepID=UPI0030FC08CD